MKLGSAVRSARQHTGLTQEELADRIGRHADTISLIECARTLPTIDLLLELAKALDRPISGLLPGPQTDITRSEQRARVEPEIQTLLGEIPDYRLEFVRDHLSLLLGLK